MNVKSSDHYALSFHKKKQFDIFMQLKCLLEKKPYEFWETTNFQFEANDLRKKRLNRAFQILTCKPIDFSSDF